MHALTSARVLLVENDAAVAALIALVLGDEGCSVDHVASPRGALALCAARGPSAFTLVLSNPFVTPRADPYAWLEQLRACVQAPIVICSGHAPTLFADYQSRGYAGLLHKPFDLRDLIGLVAAVGVGAVA